MAPAFPGRSDLQDQFLQETGVQWPAQWTVADTHAAYQLWSNHISRQRAGNVTTRPVADVLIEAFAQRFHGLITGNPKHFATVHVVTPGDERRQPKPSSKNTIELWRDASYAPGMILEKLPEVQSLTLEEKQLLVEEIWDEISRDRDPLPVPEKHLRTLEERAAEHAAHPERVKSWDDVKRGLSERFGNKG